MRAIAVFLAVVMGAALCSSKKKCYALAIEGGGAQNAYSAGVLNAIWKHIPRDKRGYDVVSGVSMGALNAFILSMYGPGMEQQAAEVLTDLWASLDSSRVYKGWDWGVVEGFFFRSGLHNLSPYKELLQTYSKINPRGFERKLIVGLTDLNSGEITTVEDTVGMKRMIEYVRASAIVPGMFPPLVEGNSVYVEGTTMLSVDIPATVQKCREIVENDEDIVLDVIMVQPVKDLQKDCKDMLALALLLRYRELNGYVLSMHQLEDVLVNFPRIQKRHIFYPKKALHSSMNSMHFSKKHIMEMLKQGEEEARDVIESGLQGAGSWDDLLKHMKDTLY